MNPEPARTLRIDGHDITLTFPRYMFPSEIAELMERIGDTREAYMRGYENGGHDTEHWLREKR